MNNQYARANSSDDRLWAMIAHLSAAIAAIVSVGWLTIVGPLLVWLFKKDSSQFVRNAAAGAFNFNITMWLITLIGWILNLTVVGAVIGVPMVFIGSIGSIVLGVWGAIKAWGGNAFRYPWQ
ncbi:MAG: DUF4870 domain-containing protein, partial [Propionibacteriaceae bacterium]|nr:DUF4870 domain-containing protein [Propionibacteriaceae bacterium]